MLIHDWLCLAIENAFSLAICALAPSSENSYLAYPSPLSSPTIPFSNSLPAAAQAPTSQQTPGDVILFDALSLSVINVIQAHKTTLACLTLNSTGSLLATASDKGTVIRVFSVPNGDKIAQFRRGTYGARIFSIAFNPLSSLLCVSSDTETVHIFRLLSEKVKASLADTSRAEATRRKLVQTTCDEDEDSPQTGSTGRYTTRAGSGGHDAFIDKKRNGGVGYVHDRSCEHTIKGPLLLIGAPCARSPSLSDVIWQAR